MRSIAALGSVTLLAALFITSSGQNIFSVSLGAYDNGFLSLVVLIITYAVVVVGPVVVAFSVIATVILYFFALFINFAILYKGAQARVLPVAAEFTFYVLSFLTGLGCFLAFTNYEGIFVKCSDGAASAPEWFFFFPAAFAVVGILFRVFRRKVYS
jgi:hypothetical protein